MSEFSPSDLNDLKRSVERIAEQLRGGVWSEGVGRNLDRMSSRLDDIKSLLSQISNKLDRR